jgi:hypothetical protein
LYHVDAEERTILTLSLCFSRVLAAPHKVVEASVVVVNSFLKNQRASQSERREVSEDTGDKERSGERGDG